MRSLIPNYLSIIDPSLQYIPSTENLWFSADQHFGHWNINKLCNRGFDSLEEMESDMIDKWNEIIKPTDLVFNLGDFTFYKDPEQIIKLINQLNGAKIFIRGGHDAFWSKLKEHHANQLIGFRGVIDRLEIRVKDDFVGPNFWQDIILTHEPLESWDRMHHGVWHLHGHSHGNSREHSLGRFDVGVDSKISQGYPISYQEIQNYFTTKLVLTK